MNGQQAGMQQPQIDLKTTSPIKTPSGKVIFQQGMILRRVSKFVTGTNEDGLIPIPVIFDPETNKILVDSVPQELREELQEELING